jgi:hypothetical protein
MIFLRGYHEGASSTLSSFPLLSLFLNTNIFLSNLLSKNPPDEASQLHNGSCVLICPGAHKIKNKGVAAGRQQKVRKLPISCPTTQNFRHFMFPGVSLNMYCNEICFKEKL